MTKLTDATIPVEDAKVEERQVTIKVLTIGTRQVTQALYKQLVEDNDAFLEDDEDGGIIRSDVTIWGWVNVCSCKETDRHYHVIYEVSGILKRARVSRAFMGSETWGRDMRERLKRITDPDAKEELRAELRQYESNWRQTLETIENVGQLFIAVSGVWK